MFIQTDPIQILLFIFSLIIAASIFFSIAMLTSFIPFWIPEVSWGAQFLIIVIFVEFLSGAFFPLDVFPEAIFKILQFTPFPYLIFVPIKTYLGVATSITTPWSLLIGFTWSLILWILMKRVWQKGLKIYEAVGR